MSRIKIGLASVFLLAVTSVLSFAADAGKRTQGRTALALGIKSHRLHSGPQGAGVKMAVIAAKHEENAFNRAIQVTVEKVPEDPWGAQVSTLTAIPLKKGHVVLASFYARAVSGEGGKGSLLVYLGTPGDENHAPSIFERISLSVSEEWTHFLMPATVVNDCARGKAMLNIDFGYQKQTIQIAGIRLASFGDDLKLEDLPRKLE